MINATITARNHIEHITERIVNERRRRTGASELSGEAFQRAIGRIEFPSIIFGVESFDLAAISGTILTTGGRIAPTLETTSISISTRFCLPIAKVILRLHLTSIMVNEIDYNLHPDALYFHISNDACKRLALKQMS